MKSFLQKRIKEKIALNEQDWADAWVAKEFNSVLTTPQAKKDLDAAKFMMEEAEKRIAFLKQLLKK